jgi:hypothetical protein
LTCFFAVEAWIRVRTGRTLERKSEVKAYLAGLGPDALCPVYASRLDDKLWALAKRARLRAPVQPPDQLAQSLARLDQLSFGPTHPGNRAESNSTSSLQDKTIPSDNKPTAETRDISCEVGLAFTDPELHGTTGFRRSSGGSVRPASPSEETPPPILETGEDLILESVASPPAALDPLLSGLILEPGRPESDPVAAVPDGEQEGGSGHPSEERVKQPTSDGRAVNPRGDEASTCADGPLSEKHFTDVGLKPAAGEGNRIEPEPGHADLQVDTAEASQMDTAEVPQMDIAEAPQMDTAEPPQMDTAEAPQLDIAEAPQMVTADVPQADTVVVADAAQTAEAAPQVNSVEAAAAACTTSGYPRKEPPAAVGGGRRVLNLKVALWNRNRNRRNRNFLTSGTGTGTVTC